MDKISRHIGYAVLAAAVLALGGCVTSKVDNKVAEIEGHYKYEHGWSYDLDGNCVAVVQKGTMTFYNDGYALDFATQHYVITLQNGCKAAWNYTYFSPSCWRVEGDDFYFAGTESLFNLSEDLLPIQYWNNSCDSAGIKEIVMELEQRINKSVKKNIGRETKFRYSKPTEKELVWSCTYPDGHTDTWEFRYINKATKKFRRHPYMVINSGELIEIPKCP